MMVNRLNQVQKATYLKKKHICEPFLISSLLHLFSAMAPSPSVFWESKSCMHFMTVSLKLQDKFWMLSLVPLECRKNEKGNYKIHH